MWMVLYQARAVCIQLRCMLRPERSGSFFVYSDDALSSCGLHLNIVLLKSMMEGDVFVVCFRRKVFVSSSCERFPLQERKQ